MDIASFDESDMRSMSDASSLTHPPHFPRKTMVGIGVGYLLLAVVSTSLAICLLMLNCDIKVSLPWLANALYGIQSCVSSLMILMGFIGCLTTRRRSMRYINTSFMLSAVYITLSYLAYVVVLVVQITEVFTYTCYYIVWIYLIAVFLVWWPAFTNLFTCDNILRDKDKVNDPQSAYHTHSFEEDIPAFEDGRFEETYMFTDGLEIRDDHRQMADTYIYL
ncbi:uncharacterized protein [Ptychodera flava]|uniref:uncharacterized protein n=1 Tax=Ptychodera flava TaxID=63121 RepID=UPI00396A43C6